MNQIVNAPGSDTFFEAGLDGEIDELGGVVVSKSNLVKVTFYAENIPVKNESHAPLDRDGQPIMNGPRPRDMIRIQGLADTQSVICRIATPRDQKAHPLEWAAYKNGTDDISVDGTPLSDLPGISNMHCQHMVALGVMTVEQAADLPEQALQTMGLMGQSIHIKAKAWLARRDETAPQMKLAEDNALLMAKLEAREARDAERDREMADMRAQLAVFRETVGAAVQAPPGAPSANPDALAETPPGVPITQQVGAGRERAFEDEQDDGMVDALLGGGDGASDVMTEADLEANLARA